MNMENCLDITPHQYIVLKLLDANNAEPVGGRIIFQKLLFLILKNFDNWFEDADFIPHLYGPFSASLDHALEDLESIKSVQEIPKKEINITEEGKNLLYAYDNELQLNDVSKEETKQKLEDLISGIKDDFKDFSSNEMLAFIYKSYPAFIDDSIVADSLDYEKIFLDLYERGMLGISKIAELMGWPVDKAYDFIQEQAGRIHAQ